MSDWRRLRLQDVITVEHGFAFSGDYFSSDPKFPTLVTPGNFKIGGGFRRAKVKTFCGPVDERYVLAPGCMLISMTDLSKEGATLGATALVPSDQVTYLHNQRVGRVINQAPQDVDIEFLNYALRSEEFHTYIVGTATGTTVRHTSPGRILGFSLSIPSLFDQRKIAEVLGALDDKIAANVRLIDTSALLALAVAETGTRQPVSLGDLVTVSRVGVNPQTLGVAEVAHFSLPAFDAGQMPTTEDPAGIQSVKFRVSEPAVLLSKLNPRFPRVWDIPVPPRDSVASTEFLVLHPKGCTTSVLWALISQPTFASLLDEKASGTSGSHQRVRPDDLLATSVGDPGSLENSAKEVITWLGARIAAARRERISLAELRDALLPQLMSGAIRVKDAEDVVGEVV